MKVICISGKAQNGKDTTAMLLRDYLTAAGERVLIAHYGDLVKYVCRQFFGWDGVKDEKGRTILQHVGTDVVRTKDPEYWVNFIVGILKLFDGEWDYVLIPDCRFPNEIDCMKKAGFDTIHIRIVRDGFVSPLTPEQQAHPSETALDSVMPDTIIHNAGSLGELNSAVIRWLNDWSLGCQHTIYDTKEVMA